MSPHQLILMRHATADAGDGDDHLRELTWAGKDEAHRVGDWLAREGVVPTRILSSSALRCRQTHDALVAGLGRPVEVEYQDQLYNAPAQTLLESLIDLSFVGRTDESETGIAFGGEMRGEDEPPRVDDVVLLIAHNPGISHLALDLATQTDETTRLRSGFSPATTASFEFTGGWSSLGRGRARLTRLIKAREI